MRTLVLTLAAMSAVAQVSPIMAPQYINPSSIPSLYLWVSGDKGCYTDAGTTPCTNGASVAQWNDQSGKGNNCTASGTGKPTYSTNTLNSLPVMTFNGTSQFFSCPTSFAGNYFTIFYVVRQTTLQDFTAYVAESNGALPNYFGLITGTIASGHKYGQGKFGTSDNEVALTATVNVWDVMTALSNGSADANQISTIATGAKYIEVLFRQNGVVAQPYNSSYTGIQANLTAGADVKLGAAMGGTSNYLKGQIAEVLIYRARLSNWQTSQVEAYLSHKWNISVTAPAGNSAQSFDGISLGPVVLSSGSTGYDDTALYGARAVYDAGTYNVAYVALQGTLNSIAYATGTSPMSLTKGGQLLQGAGGGSGVWDSAWVSCVVPYKDPNYTSGHGPWWIFYCGGNIAGLEAGVPQVGCAYSSTFAGPYTRCSGNPIIAPSGSGWNSNSCYYPSLLYKSPSYYVFVNCKGGTETVGYYTASTLDGTWTPYASNPVLTNTATTYDAQIVGDMIITQPDPLRNHWVAMNYGTDFNLCCLEFMAESDDLITWTKYSGNYLRAVGFPSSETYLQTNGLGRYWGYLDNRTTAIYYAPINRGPL